MGMGVGQGVLAMARCHYRPWGLGGPSSALELAVWSCCFCRCTCSDCYPDGCGAVGYLAVLGGRRC